jgi:hypothetical protein
MCEFKKAYAWFNSKGIRASISDDQLYVHIEGLNRTYCQVLVSASEVLYRANLYDQENNI